MLNIELPYNSAIPLVSIQEKWKCYVHIKSCTEMFITELFTMAKCGKQPKCLSTDEMN